MRGATRTSVKYIIAAFPIYINRGIHEVDVSEAAYVNHRSPKETAVSESTTPSDYSPKVVLNVLPTSRYTNLNDSFHPRELDQRTNEDPP